MCMFIWNLISLFLLLVFDICFAFAMFVCFYMDHAIVIYSCCPNYIHLLVYDNYAHVYLEFDIFFVIVNF